MLYVLHKMSSVQSKVTISARYFQCVDEFQFSFKFQLSGHTVLCTELPQENGDLIPFDAPVVNLAHFGGSLTIERLLRHPCLPVPKYFWLHLETEGIQL